MGVHMSSITKRERQILSWIEEDPSISQAEIAERAGISRSSVAVHISNLMRKGVILGRRYVVRDHPYVVVIGGANIDIGGWPEHVLVARDSNPGTVTTSPGGAGRNIAHNLSLLGIDVRLITAFGTDEYAGVLRAACRGARIDISHSLTVPNFATSTYLYVTDETGSMTQAISDMKIFERLTPTFFEQHMHLINNSTACIIDANLPQSSIEFIVDHAGVPIFCDPVSTAKAPKVKRCLGKLTVLKPNVLELETLTGIKVTDDASLDRAVSSLLETGLKSVFVSRGADGLYCARDDERLSIPTLPTKVVNTTGAGDCLMAAIVWGWLDKRSLEEIGRLSNAAAATCVESPETINSLLSPELVQERLERSAQ